MIKIGFVKSKDVSKIHVFMVGAKLHVFTGRFDKKRGGCYDSSVNLQNVEGKEYGK